MKDLEVNSKVKIIEKGIGVLFLAHSTSKVKGAC